VPTADCALLPLESRFKPIVREWLRDDDTRAVLGTLRAPSDAEHDRWYEVITTDPTRHTAVIVHDDEPVGLCGLTGIDLVYRKAELWLYLGDAASRGKGYGRQAVDQLLRHAFHTLGLHRVGVRVFAFNASGHDFFHRCGFTDEGVERDGVFKLGRYHDVWFMGMLEPDFSS
jgi:RimJ/RimL family protein N-acetyltransferase